MGIRNFFNNPNLFFDGERHLILAKFDKRSSPLLPASNIGGLLSKEIDIFTGKLSTFRANKYSETTLKLFVAAHRLLKS
jgi:hypothetical protein